MNKDNHADREKRKRFRIHDLYPANYCFDWEAFIADPEHYVFTEDDLAYSNAMDLERFERKTPMTPAEKRALRKWVKSGHSIWDNPGSKYICDLGLNFLEVYRADHEIAAAIRGKTPDEKEAYIKEYVGYEDPTPEELERMDAIRNTSAYVITRYEEISHQLDILWNYLIEKGLNDDARIYLEKHMDDEPPIPFSLILT